MGYESDGSGFESSSEQVDASLSTDSIDAGSAEIAEPGDQYDFDEADVGEYDPEALGEDAEISEGGMESGYEESEEFQDPEGNDFDEADVGEYDPESVGEKDTESDEENPEGGDEDTESDEENPEDGDEDTESDEESPEDGDEDTESDGENPEDGDEDTESDEENPEDGDEDAESDEENPEGVDEDAESDEENPEGEDEDTESDEESPEGVDEDTESDEENPEGVDEDTESDEENPEGVDEDAESDEENPEGEDEDTESDEESPEGVDEDAESDEENPEDGDEDTESDEENPEGEDEDTESDEENPEDGDEDTESDEENPEDGDEDTESDEESPEGEDEDTESDEENPEGEDEDTESDEENPEDVDEDTESDEENPEGVDEDTESDEENPESVDEDAESDEENPEGEDEDAESDEENPEGVDEDTESDEENPEDGDEDTEENPEGEDEDTESDEENPEGVDEDTESDEENPEGEGEDTESDEENPEGEDEDAESDEENPEDGDEDTESDGENPEDGDEDTESDEESPEGVDEDAESDEENPEGEDEDTESDEENPEDGDEDTESDEESPEDGDEDTESDEENPEDGDEDIESDEENPEDEDEDTESDEENPEDGDEDPESDEENPEGEDEDTESDEENPEGEDEDTESDEQNPEGVDEDAESDEENPEDGDEDTESDGEDEEYHEAQQAAKPNGKKNAGPEGGREREDIAHDIEGGQRERNSFIEATEKERPGGVMAMGGVVAASEVAAMRREEMRQARNAETPDLHRGETVPTLREGHEQTIIAATENKLEDNQPPEMFPETRMEPGAENHPEQDYSDERPEEPSADRESEKKAVADDGSDADPDQDAAGQIAQAAQAAAAGLAAGAPGGPFGGSSGSGGSGDSPNGSDEPASGSGVPGKAGESPGDEHTIEQAGSRVRVEIPLMTGHQLGSVPLGEAPQFGQPLSQLQRLVNQVPIPTNEMQGDAALADMIARTGIPPARLGFPNNVVTTEDVRVFRNSRGLRWLRLGDRKSLVLVDASSRTYVQELKELAEPDDGTEPEAEKQIEAPDVPKEEFERRLEAFDEIETAEYERQKQFDVNEEGLRHKRETLLGDYTCHGLEHIREVMGESERYISALEKSGIEVSESLRQSCGVAAKYHDIGMAESGGMELSRDLAEKVKRPDGDFSKLVEYYNLDPDATIESTEARMKELIDAAGEDKEKVKAAQDTGRMQALILNAKAKAEQLREMPPDDPRRIGTEKVYRGQLTELQERVHADLRNSHARKSAQYVLSRSDEFKERYGKNVDPRNVACAIMLHTKTNSGCGDLTALTAEAAGTDHLSVEESCSKLVADWNLNHGDQRVETTFSEADLKEIAFMASVLRTADNRRDGTTATFTNGDRVLCEASGDKVEVYHGKEKNGAVEKIRRAENPKSEEIISAESCAQFGEIRPEGGNMVHVMRFNGLGSAPLERRFAERRIVDYVGEVESGVFKSAASGSGADGGVSGGVNMIEVHVPGASQADCGRLEREWKRLLENTDKEAAKQYGAAGRLRVLPAGKEENA